MTSNPMLVSRQAMAVAVVSSLLSVSACAMEKRPTAGSDQQPETVPFSITFDRQGNPLVLDRDGRRIEPTQIEYPVKTTSIESVSAITAVHAYGSDFYILSVNGRSYKITLPH